MQSISERLRSACSRGKRTLLELLIAGVAKRESHVARLLQDA